MSTVAVVLALTTGTAYAAGLANNSVKGRHIAADAIKERHISDGAVRGPDIGTGQVGSRGLADGEVAGVDIGTGQVDGRVLKDSTITVSDMGVDSVSRSEIKAGGVESAEIADETITGIDVAPGSISSTRMTTGVRGLLFDTGVLAVNQTFPDLNVSNDNWPGGAPSSGAQMSHTWTQPANTLQIVSAIARVAFPASCSATAGTPRGFDVKITDAAGRVISASAAQRTGSQNYNGNGFWAEQDELPGVSYRAPNGTDLADTPDSFVDYIHLPFEMAELIAGGSDTSRTVRIFYKRNSSNCTPSVTDARLIVYSFA